MGIFSLVTSGVSQVSVVGPVLFLAYSDDLTTAVRSSLRLFADDSKVHKIIFMMKTTRNNFNLISTRYGNGVKIGNFVFPCERCFVVCTRPWQYPFWNMLSHRGHPIYRITLAPLNESNTGP